MHDLPVSYIDTATVVVMAEIARAHRGLLW